MADIEAIRTTYLEDDTSSVEWTSISQTYENLVLRISGKCHRSNAANDDIGLRFNNDSGSNYSYFRMVGSESDETTSRNNSVNLLKVSSITSDAGLAGSENYATLVVDIFDYTNPYRNTSVTFMGGITAGPLSYHDSGTRSVFGSGFWDSTAAVNRINLITNSGADWCRGSVFSLYGWND